MVEVFKSVACITEKDIQVGDFVRVDYSDSLYKVYEVEDDQVKTNGLDGSFWIDIAAVVSVEKQTKNQKKDDKKMIIASVQLDDSQIEELLHHVDVSDYVTFFTMDEWDDFMDGIQATEIIDSTGGNYFNTADVYAVEDSIGNWYSTDSLEEILEPYLDEMLQEFIDNTLS